MSQTALKDKAQNLRKSGLSLNEITAHLKIPKSTIRYWCRDITLSLPQLRRLARKQKMGGIISGEKLRKKRIITTKKLFEEGLNEIKQISKQISPRELLLIGAALYWAEGYRKGDGEFGFTNSDPRMIKLIIKWLTNSCDIPKKKIHVRVCINNFHKNRITEIQKFWSKTIIIPLAQFSKPTLIKVKNKKVYKNSSLYFGTLRVKVRQSKNLRRKIKGWIEGISKIAI